MKQPAHDPLFLCDLKEIKDDFEGIEILVMEGFEEHKKYKKTASM